jgi:hypothetical protein
VCEPQGGVGGAKRLDRCGQRPQYRRIMSRFLCKAFIDDDGGYVGIDHGGAEGVFEASDEHRLINEGVQRTAQPAPFGAQVWPIRRRHTGNDQHLEVWTMRFRSPQRRRKQIGQGALAVVVNIPIVRMLAERSRLQGLHNAGRKRCSGRRVARGRGLLQGGHQARTGVTVKFFRDLDLGEQGVKLVAIPGAAGPGIRGVQQEAPVIGSRAGSGEKLIDPVVLNLFFVGHRFLPLVCVGRSSIGIHLAGVS